MKVIKEINLTVTTDLKQLDQVLSYFSQIHETWIPKKDWLQCQLALAEGFTNAVRHAHKDLPSTQPIEIQLALLEINKNQYSIEMRIWDWGPIFDLEAFVKNLPFSEHQNPSGGRGIPILKKIADHLSYIRCDENRNCLLIIKEFFSVEKNVN